MSRIKKHDPTPQVPRIEELVRRVKEGDIKLPKFQRPFVWERSDILDLWDSVYKGFPISSLLLWTTKHRLSSLRTIGDLSVNDRAEEYPTNYLLDGQQRLSTLCGVLFWDGKNPKSKWNVAFDMKTEQFFYPTGDLEGHHFPMNKLLETTDFVQQALKMQQCPETRELIPIADRLLSAVKDYKVAAVVLKDMDIEEVAPIFERINSTGRRLTVVDLMVAATWSSDFDLSDRIAQLKSALDQSKFSKVRDKTVLQSLSAGLDHGITAKDLQRIRKEPSEVLEKVASATQKSYLRAVDFLRSELGVPSIAYIPYSLQLVLLVEFFRRCPNPTSVQRAVLRRWFWRTSFAEYFKGANTSVMGDSLAMIRAVADGERADLDIGVSINANELVYDDFSLNKAVSKAFALLLASGNPRSLLNGSPVRVAEALSHTNQAEFHHIFPKAHLRRQGVEEKNDRNRHANIALVKFAGNRKFASSPPSVYLPDIVKACGEELPAILKSHFISNEAWKAALQDDYDSFTLHREETLTRHLESLTNSMR